MKYWQRYYRERDIFGSPSELRVPQPVVQAFRSGFRFTPTLGKHAGLTFPSRYNIKNNVIKGNASKMKKPWFHLVFIGAPTGGAGADSGRGACLTGEGQRSSEPQESHVVGLGLDVVVLVDDDSSHQRTGKPTHPTQANAPVVDTQYRCIRRPFGLWKTRSGLGRHILRLIHWHTFTRSVFCFNMLSTLQHIYKSFGVKGKLLSQLFWTKSNIVRYIVGLWTDCSWSKSRLRCFGL